MGQHILTYRGDTVRFITISEDNSYCDRLDNHEMVYLPSAWITYDYVYRNEQRLLERKSRRTKTTPTDSTSLLLMDSLIAELSVCRMATAADLGITEKMIHKTMSSREKRRLFGSNYYKYDRNRYYLKDFDRWLAKLYKNYCDTNCVTIITERYFQIKIQIELRNFKQKHISFWRYHPEDPIYVNSRNFFNLNIYRYLCALMPKTFDFSYEDFQKRLIFAYFNHIDDWN
jgi:hypothetical protein